MNTIDSTPPARPLAAPAALQPQAEQALLGALLANNKAYERVSEFLSPSISPTRSTAASTAPSTAGSKRANWPTRSRCRAEFEHTGVLDEVGGTAYLAQLLTAMVGIINAGEYGRAIHDAWLRRQLIDVGEEVVNNAFGADAGARRQRRRWRPPSSAVRPGRTGRPAGRLHHLPAGADLRDPLRRARPSTARAMSPACRPGCGTWTRRSAACTRPT